MLEVVSLEEAQEAVVAAFAGVALPEEAVPLEKACGRVLAHNVLAREGIPPFDRSTVDGYAVCASDTFGCSDALPALARLAGEVEMGKDVSVSCTSGTCVRIPTGGKLPAGADAVVMLEYCEEYGDGTVGIARPVAPGENVAFAHDDVAIGATIVPQATRLAPHHVGTLASLGIDPVTVCAQQRVGIISTGDEIVAVRETPVASQMRDVNTPLLEAVVAACGALPVVYPIVPDEYDALLAAVKDACATCDMVLVSGGSSAGQKDNTARVLSQLGNLLFHGIAVKPGKPTMCANVGGKPVFGLPGHPVAAYFMFLEVAACLLGPAAAHAPGQPAVLAEALPSNHGRAELVPVTLVETDNALAAVPIHSKSGLISQLCTAHGYVVVGRNQEGLQAGATVHVRPLVGTGQHPVAHTALQR